MSGRDKDEDGGIGRMRRGRKGMRKMKEEWMNGEDKEDGAKR